MKKTFVNNGKGLALDRAGAFIAKHSIKDAKVTAVQSKESKKWTVEVTYS